MKTYKHLTHAKVLELFTYRDGFLYWNERPGLNFWNALFAGKVAGAIDDRGYGSVGIRHNDKIVGYLVHRLVWFYHHGYLPPEVDHKNGKPSDNRIENLRAACRRGNTRNVRIGLQNTSGYKGISFERDRQKWRACIKYEGRSIHIGRYETPERAAAAYDVVARRLHGEFAALNFPAAGERSARP